MADRETCYKATGRIYDHVDTAWEAMHTLSLATDGYGILRDPSRVKAKLRDARAAIDATMAELKGTDWPTADDYELWS